MGPARVRRAGVLAAVWAVPGALSVGQLWALQVYREADESLGALIVTDLLPWQVWALATPLVVRAGRLGTLSLRTAGWWIPLHLLLNAAIALAWTWSHVACGKLAGLDPYAQYAVSALVPPMLIKSAFVQILAYWAVIGADRGLAAQRRVREAELQRAQLEARLVEARLDALRAQIRPHFLFNTLNTLSVLARKGDTEPLLRTIGSLSELLRRSIDRTAEVVSLDEELDFVDRYLDIVRARFPDRLRVVLDIEPAALDCPVPGLLLQPIVENAIEHGVAPRSQGGTVEISAHLLDDRLRIEICDDGPGLRSDHREGVGVGHVRKRLAQHYPGAHAFSVTSGPSGGARVVIEIPAPGAA